MFFQVAKAYQRAGSNLVTSGVEVLEEHPFDGDPPPKEYLEANLFPGQCAVFRGRILASRSPIQITTAASTLPIEEDIVDRTNAQTVDARSDNVQSLNKDFGGGSTDAAMKRVADVEVGVNRVESKIDALNAEVQKMAAALAHAAPKTGSPEASQAALPEAPATAPCESMPEPQPDEAEAGQAAHKPIPPELPPEEAAVPNTTVGGNSSTHTLDERVTNIEIRFRRVEDCTENLARTLFAFMSEFRERFFGEGPPAERSINSSADSTPSPAEPSLDSSPDDADSEAAVVSTPSPVEPSNDSSSDDLAADTVSTPSPAEPSSDSSPATTVSNPAPAEPSSDSSPDDPATTVSNPAPAEPSSDSPPAATVSTPSPSHDEEERPAEPPANSATTIATPSPAKTLSSNMVEEASPVAAHHSGQSAGYSGQVVEDPAPQHASYTSKPTRQRADEPPASSSTDTGPAAPNQNLNVSKASSTSSASTGQKGGPTTLAHDPRANRPADSSVLQALSRTIAPDPTIPPVSPASNHRVAEPPRASSTGTFQCGGPTTYGDPRQPRVPHTDRSGEVLYLPVGYADQGVRPPPDPTLPPAPSVPYTSAHQAAPQPPHASPAPSPVDPRVDALQAEMGAIRAEFKNGLGALTNALSALASQDARSPQSKQAPTTRPPTTRSPTRAPRSDLRADDLYFRELLSEANRELITKSVKDIVASATADPPPPPPQQAPSFWSQVTPTQVVQVIQFVASQIHHVQNGPMH